jgi:exosortase A
MSAPSLVAASALPASRPGNRAALGVLAVGLGLLGLLFHPEIAAAVRVWIGSTAYNHCFLVLPIAAWLAWSRRDRLAGAALAPTPVAALLAVPLALAWFTAERLGLMEGRQFAALGLAETLVLVVLGWELFRAFAAPLLYLVFLVPFGAFTVPALQVFTARFVTGGLGLLGIPHSADAELIRIPEGAFYIAPACAGLRFLIAALAFGALYAVVMYRSPRRRALFLAAALIVPVIANGLRALGIVLLGHLLGSAEAAAVDHVLYGWLFFSLVLLLLAFLGALFREDPAARAARSAPPERRAPPPGRLAGAVLGVLIAAAGPLAAGLLDRAAAAAPVTIPSGFAPAAGCTPVPEALRGTALLTAAAGAAVAAFACTVPPVTLWVEAFPPATPPKPMLRAAAQAVGGAADADEAIVERIATPGVEPPGWLVVAIADPPRAAATALWIDGRPEAGLAARLRQAWNSLAGGGRTPVLVVIESEAGGERGIRMIRLFLEREAGLGAAITRLAAAPPARGR